MSTIGNLLALAADPGIKPWDEIVKSSTDAQTGLITLADLKAKQRAEQESLTAIKNDPELRQRLFGGSILGSIGPAGGQGGPPAPGPMTQQQVMPGQSPGAPQTVPGGQDLSQFATQGAPPQSTIGSLGPAGQPQMQAPRNPVLEMAQRDPRAAMMLQQQMQGQQDRQWKLQEQQGKMQEQQLSNGVKIAEYVSRMLQGVTDQDSLDKAREQIRQVHPQAASQVPQMYSKEGIEALRQRGASITEMAQNRYHEAKARNLDMETQTFPELAKRLGMGDDAQTTGEGGATTTTVVPTTGKQARTAPPEFESAIADATRLYPQVKPERIKSIIAAESNYDAKAVSSAGAKGPMQLMDATAKDMGVDDPFNVQQNVLGGTRYYAQMLTRYGGDERKALAAYNWGPGNLDKVNGDVSKAPAETQAYVQKVLGGGTTGTAQTSASDPRIAQLDKKIAERTQHAQVAAALKNESLSTRLNDEANRLTAEKNRLIDQSRHQQERAEEIPLALKRDRLLTEQKQDLERQRQAGPLLPEERRKHLTGLRENVLKEPTFKTYQDVRNGYQNVKVGAASDSAQGDLAIFNGLAKILDPTSSVMSGEAKNIEEAQGQLQIWFNSPAKFLEGDRISKENRPRFLKMAYELAKEKLTTAQTELKTVWGPMAQEVGIDFNQVVPLPDLKPLEPGPNVSKFEKALEGK